jgi:hypothetical protein
MAIVEIIFGPKHPNCVDLKFWAKSIPISSNVHVVKSLKKAKIRAEAKGGINPANKTAAQQPKARAVASPVNKIVARQPKAKVVATILVATKTATTAAQVTIGAETTAIVPTMVASPTRLTAKTAVHKLKVVAPILLATPFQKPKRKNANANVKRLLLAKKAKAVRANKVKARTREVTTAVETTVVAAKVNVRTHKAVATITTTIADHSNAPINKVAVAEIALHLKKTTAKYLNARLKKKSRQPWPVFPVGERKNAKSCNVINGIVSANVRKSWNKKPKAANCR